MKGLEQSVYYVELVNIIIITISTSVALPAWITTPVTCTIDIVTPFTSVDTLWGTILSKESIVAFFKHKPNNFYKPWPFKYNSYKQVYH